MTTATTVSNDPIGEALIAGKPVKKARAKAEAEAQARENERLREAAAARVAGRMAWLDTELASIHGALRNIAEQNKLAQGHAMQFGDAGATADLGKLTAKRMKLQTRLDELGGLKNRVTTWVRRAGPNLRIAKKTGYKTPTSFAELEAAIRDIRSEISRLKNEMFQIERAPVRVKPSELREQAAAVVRELAELGKPPVCHVDPKGRLKFDLTNLGSAAPAHCYVAWLFEDRMIDRIVKQVEAVQTANGRKALGVEAKRDKLAELSQALDAAERREVMLVDAAIAAELPFHHRPDVALTAFLQVLSDEPEHSKVKVTW